MGGKGMDTCAGNTGGVMLTLPVAISLLVKLTLLLPLLLMTLVIVFVFAFEAELVGFKKGCASDG
jgi:hypothetical protein